MQDLAALKQALEDYTDVTTSPYFPRAVSLCCQRIARDTRLTELPFEVTEVVQGVDMPSGYHTLPAGFAGIEDFGYAANGGRVVPSFRVARTFWNKYNAGQIGQFPLQYTIEHDVNGLARFVLGDVQPADYAYQITYTLKPTALVADTDTNWLLQNHEAIYLYGSLIELAPFRDEDYRAQTWAQFYDDAADEFVKMVKAQKFPRGDTQRPSGVLSVI